MSWTDERIVLLKQLWGEGKSAAEIAKALGAGLTRNAVIGKAHRLKLSNRVSPIQQNNKKTAAAAPAPKAVEEKKAVPAKSKVAAAATVSAAPSATPKKVGKGVSLGELKERMCRWPSGDPKDADFHFCGEEGVPGLPYCSVHAKAAYQTPNRARALVAEDFDKPRNNEPAFAEDELKEVANA